MPTRDRSEVLDRILRSESDPNQRILFTGARIVTMTAAGDYIGDILVTGNRIEAVAPNLADSVDESVIRVDASDSIIIPGLIDSHVHAWEGQLRGVAPAADFGGYMGLTHGGLAMGYRPEDMAIAEKLSAAQAINAGTTTIVDNSHNSRTRDHSNAAIEALLGTGIRAVYAAGGAQAGEHENQLPTDLIRLREEYFSGQQDRVSLRMFDIVPTVESWTFAAQNGFDVCAEMGMWVPELPALIDAKLMGPGHSYNHCAGLSPDTWQAIADSGAAINLVPRSDSQYGLGSFVPVLEANRYGIQEGISSDNESGYGHDLFTEMRTLLTIQRGLAFAEEFAGNADAPRRYTAIDVLRAATVGGALNAGLSDSVGTIEAGKKADFVLISLAQVNTRLWGATIGTVVGFAGIGNVDTVVIDGKIKKWDGELVGVDYDALVTEGEASREYLLDAFGSSVDEVRTGLANDFDAAASAE